MKEDFEVRDEDMEAMLKELGGILKDSMPEGWGFTLLMYTYDKGATFYVSSGHRADVMRMLKEFIAKQEQGHEDTPT